MRRQGFTARNLSKFVSGLLFHFGMPKIDFKITFNLILWSFAMPKNWKKVMELNFCWRVWNIWFINFLVYYALWRLFRHPSIFLCSQESYQSVYNWQYISCLQLWCQVICDLYGDILKPLVYPLVQITIGVIR